MNAKPSNDTNDIEFNDLSHQAISKKEALKEPLSTPVLAEDDCTSLWQYAIHETNNVSDWFETFLPIVVSLYYFTTFYCIIEYLNVTSPPTKVATNRVLFNLAKYFFTAFLIIQAECECFDGWKMLGFAQGHKKRIIFFGCMQYISGTFVEIVSYSLINRSVNIMNILSSSACLTVFLRIDDVVLATMNKFFPNNKKKVTYEKGRFDKTGKSFVLKTMAIKYLYFIIAEILNEAFSIQIFV